MKSVNLLIYGYLYFLAFYWHCCYKMHNTHLPLASARLVPERQTRGHLTSGVQLLVSAREPRDVCDKFQGSPRSLVWIIPTCFIGWITNCLSFLIGVFFYLLSVLGTKTRLLALLGWTLTPSPLLCVNAAASLLLPLRTLRLRARVLLSKEWVLLLKKTPVQFPASTPGN